MSGPSSFGRGILYDFDLMPWAWDGGLADGSQRMPQSLLSLRPTAGAKCLQDVCLCRPELLSRHSSASSWKESLIIGALWAQGQVQPDAVRAGPDSGPQLRWVAVPLRVRRQVQVWKDRGLRPLSAWARAPGQPDFRDPRWALASTGFTGPSASAVWLESTAQDGASLFPGAMPLGSCGCFEGRGFLTSLCLCCPRCP